MPDDLTHRLPKLSKAINDALVAHHGLKSALKEGTRRSGRRNGSVPPALRCLG